MAQSREVRGTATNIRTDEKGTHVRYHNTDVVSFNDRSITLRTGGWDTNTTRLRMNQASNQFGLGYSVFRKNGSTYVRTADGLTVPFDDVANIQRRA